MPLGVYVPDDRIPDFGADQQVSIAEIQQANARAKELKLERVAPINETLRPKTRRALVQYLLREFLNPGAID